MGGNVRRGGNRGGTGAGRLRPVRYGRGRQLRQSVADEGPGGFHDAGYEAGPVGDLGRVPGHELAGPDLRLRLSGEHRGLADVRVAAEAGPRWRHRAWSRYRVD